jgi:hypothetical protein
VWKGGEQELWTELNGQPVKSRPNLKSCSAKEDEKEEEENVAVSLAASKHPWQKKQSQDKYNNCPGFPGTVFVPKIW